MFRQLISVRHSHVYQNICCRSARNGS